MQVQTDIESRLRAEASFGDLVEIALNSEKEYCAVHSQGNVIISPRDGGVEYNERGILYVSGYYGGMKCGDFREGMGISGDGVTPVFIYSSSETVVCLDPTLHREDAVDKLHFQGAGLIKVPISAMASYRIFSRKRRGLRVVN